MLEDGRRREDGAGKAETHRRRAARTEDLIDDLPTENDLEVERLRRDIREPAARSTTQITK